MYCISFVIAQAQVNDLIQSQQQDHAAESDADADQQNYSNGTTPKCSPSPSLFQNSHQGVGQERSRTNPVDSVSVTEKSSYTSGQHSREHGHDIKTDGTVPSSSEISHSRHSQNHSRQMHRDQSEHFQPTPELKHPLLLGLGGGVDQSLPPLHPDVLQQQFTGDISMLPVPRIMYMSSSSDGGPYYRGAGGTTFLSQLGGADYTVDENVQLADMIALKYLGKKSDVTANGLQGENHNTQLF